MDLLEEMDDAWFVAESMNDLINCFSSPRASVSKVACCNARLDHHVDDFVEAIEKNRTVQMLRLENVDMSFDFASKLAWSLQTNRSLTSLSLQGNSNIKDDGIVLFAQALKLNETLRSLNLVGTGFALRGLQALEESLEENHSLIVLDLACSNKSLEERKLIGSIQRSLKRNKGSKVVTLQCALCADDAINISCLLPSGNEVASYEAYPAYYGLGIFRMDLARRLRINRVRLHLTLPSGVFLSRDDDDKEFGEMIGIVACPAALASPRTAAIA